MDMKWYRDRLDAGGAAIVALYMGLDDASIRRRPADDGWSLLEILNHLADEEVEDFRTRLLSTLEDPAEPWPGIDPPAWVVDRAYRDRDPAESLKRFREARAESLAILDGLREPAWANTYEHPLLGSITAADLLASWIAHDQLHLRQIARRFHEAAAEHGGTDYAGPW